MEKIENGCIDCMRSPCLGVYCQYKKEEHHYCDDCGKELELYAFEDAELCLFCALDRLNRIW